MYLLSLARIKLTLFVVHTHFSVSPPSFFSLSTLTMASMSLMVTTYSGCRCHSPPPPPQIPCETKRERRNH